MKKNVGIADSLDKGTLSRLPSDKLLLKKLAREIDAESDVKHLETVFLKIARHKNAPAIFRAIGATLGPEKNLLVLKNVVAIFGKQYKEGSVKGLQHLYPLIIETQRLDEENKRKLAKARRIAKSKAKARQKKPSAHARA